MKVDIQPLTPPRWNDLVALFESRGCSIARGCWCTFYRETGKTLVPAGKTLREARKDSMKKLVDRGVIAVGMAADVPPLAVLATVDVRGTQG